MVRKSSSGGDAHRRNTVPKGQAPGTASLLTRREGRAGAALVAAAMGVIALIPGPSGPPTLIGWDKLDHLAAFAALTVLARCGWPSLPRWALAGIAFAYGVAIEIGQATLTQGRVASASDAVANGFGIAAGLALAWAFGRVGRALPMLNRRR